MAAPNRQLEFETLQVHAGQEPDPTTKARAVPIYSTVAYVANDSDHLSDLLDRRVPGHFYTRTSNPTFEVFEKRMAALEGGAAAVATASGTSALFLAIFTIADAGDNIVSSSQIFIGTYVQFKNLFLKFGIEVRLIRGHDPEDFRAAIDDKTKAILVESISNPRCDVAPMPELAKVAHENGIPFIVDNTFGMGGYLVQPISLGADIVVHSATKWIGGHGNTIAGVIIDSGKFDWGDSGKFPWFLAPSGGFVYKEAFGSIAFAEKLRMELLTYVGTPLNPFGAFLVLQGLETLSLRSQRHSENSLALANWLERHPKVAWVSHLGLESHPTHKRAKELLRPNAYSSVLCFGMKAEREAWKKAVGALQLASHLANIGDVKTLVTDYWTFAQKLSEEEKLDMGITYMVRVSVGIEHINDIIADFEQALAHVP